MAALPESYNVGEKDIGCGTKDNVNKLKEVRDLVEYAEGCGGRGSGKWGLVWESVRMGCTRYYRVIPSPVGLDEEGERRWVLPETENEWEEWERQWEGDMALKRNAESQRAALQDDAEVLVNAVVGDEAHKAGGTKEKTNPSKEPSPLGFPVIKRSHTIKMKAPSQKETHKEANHGSDPALNPRTPKAGVKETTPIHLPSKQHQDATVHPHQPFSVHPKPIVYPSDYVS